MRKTVRHLSTRRQVRIWSVVVLGSTDMLVLGQRGVRLLFEERGLVETAFQHGPDRAIPHGAGPDLDRPSTGGFEALGTVLFGEAKHPHAAAEAMFGVRPGAQDLGAYLAGRLTDGCRPAQDARWRPFPIATVAGGHMLSHRRVGVGPSAAHVTGHAVAVVEDFDRGVGVAHVQLATDELIGHRVEVLVDLHVVIDAGATRLPVADVVALSRQRKKRRHIEGLESRSSGAVELLERLAVEQIELLADRLIELGQGEEGAVSESCQDATFGVQHARLHLGLISRGTDACRQNRGAVVSGHLGVAAVERRLVVAGPLHRCLGVIGDDEAWYPVEELQGPHVDANPVAELLAQRGFCVGVVRTAERGDKEVGRPLLPGLLIDEADAVTSPVDKELVAGLVLLTHHGVDVAAPEPVALTKPAVADGIWVGLVVLLPEQAQRYMLALKLLVYPVPVRERTGRRLLGRGEFRWTVKTILELSVGQMLDVAEGEPGLGGALEGRRNRVARDGQAAGNLPPAQAELVMEPENFSNLVHGQAVCGHRCSSS